MTNAEIILEQRIELMKQGILEPTGETIIIENEKGEKKEMQMPEQIHTFAAWKSLGYKVKKGEKNVAQFLIWKHVSKNVTNDETGEEKTKSRMFMKKASFFKASQVERIV